MKFTEVAAPDFDLAITLNSGQVFHWENAGDGFIGTIGDLPVYVKQDGQALRAKVASASSRCGGEHGQDAHATVRNYFALDHPLAEICASFPDDPVMEAARSFCRGLRIIRQPRWECLATFICSSMKQVAHIRQISRALRERFGDAYEIDNGGGGRRATWTGKPARVDESGSVSISQAVYSFPTADRVARSSERKLRECALGYRAKNLLATARLVASGEVALEAWATLSDLDLRARLCELPGVGAKVANCVMLFAYERLRAFPIDVWIERVLREQYFSSARKLNASRLRTFTQEHFGKHGGYAQQYLFHYARMASRKPGAARDSSTALRSARNDTREARRNSRWRRVDGRRGAVGAAHDISDTTHSTGPGPARRVPAKILRNRAKRANLSPRRA